MDQAQKNRLTENGEPKPYSFSDEATKKRIKKHLADIKDVITEADIANAKVPGEEDTHLQAEETEKKVEIPAEGKPATPWDIID